jgi:glycosyltransferase involved in cell wall biosynthesis
VRLLVLAHAPSIHTRRWVEALVARGHELRLLTVEPPGAPLSVPWRVVGARVPVRFLRYWSAVGAVRSELRAFRPDATVAHFVPNYGFLAARAGARPLGIVAWGSDLLINARRSPVHRARARFALGRADWVHVDAEVLGAAAESLGVPRARVWVRAWGVDVDALAPGEAWAVRRGRSAALRILWTRQLEPLYRPDVFLRALGSLARSGVAFEATLAGSGSMRAPLERIAADEGVADRTQFAGWLDAPSLAALYRAHDAYVSLSRSDSTSQALLEAMAAGLVPVVSDIAGNREWVTHRRHGLLVPDGDARAVACALAEIARDTVAASALAEAARAEASRRARFSDTVAMTEERLGSLR